MNKILNEIIDIIAGVKLRIKKFVKKLLTIEIVKITKLKFAISLTIIPLTGPQLIANMRTIK